MKTIIVCLLMSLSALSAYACPFAEGDYSIAVKKAALDYLSSPGSGKLDKEDVKTMVLFYLNTPSITSSTDCTVNDVDMLAQYVDDGIGDNILTKLGTRRLITCDKCGATSCGSANGAGQSCVCISLDSDDSNYEACHLSPMRPGPPTCSSCRDGTLCGKTNSEGRKCACPTSYACYLSNAPNCADSDGGKDYYTKGTVTGWSGSFYTYTDNCLDAAQLNEYYCSASASANTVKTCSESCFNGACVVTGICSTCLPDTTSCHMTCDGNPIDSEGAVVESCTCSGGALKVQTASLDYSVTCSMCP